MLIWPSSNSMRMPAFGFPGWSPHMGQPQRLLLTGPVTETAMDTPLELFAQRSTSAWTPGRSRIARCRFVFDDVQNQRLTFVGVVGLVKPENTDARRRPGTATIGPRLPTIWRALSDPVRYIQLPPAKKGRWVGDPGALDVPLAWQSPAQGLIAGTKQDGNNDPRLSLIEHPGERLDALLDHLWHGCGDYESVAESPAAAGQAADHHA